MIEARNLIKEFGSPPQRILHDLSFQINTGEFVSISGKSGSGKSTLLYLLSSLDHPTSGEVLFDGEDIHLWSSNKLHKYRSLHIGFIFQFHYLLAELSAIENILLPARNLGVQKAKMERALYLMHELGIADKADRSPSKMSGGEQQRVAIARALIMEPRFIFADEPTGNLDSQNANLVMKMLMQINQTNKTTICLVTHDPDYAQLAHREIYLVDGRIAPRP